MHNICCWMPTSPANPAVPPARGIRTAGLNAYYDGPMPSPSRLCAALVTPLALIAFAEPVLPQTSSNSLTVEGFQPRFQSVLQQHGVVGGAFSFVRANAPTRTLAFGEMSSD